MKSKELALCALFSAMMAVCAWLSIPLFGVPVTLQTFAVFLALFTLGGKPGSISVAVYLALGAVGLPVFSGFHGGFGAFFGATGGFLWGLLAAALLFWGITAVFGEKSRLIAVIAGLLLCYICGAVWFSHVYAGSENPILLTVLPFVLPDGIKIALAWVIARRLRRHMV